MSLELTSDPKAEIRFRSKNSAVIKELANKVNFSLVELEALSLIYFKMLVETESKTDQVPRSVLRTIFEDCFNITDKFLIDRAILVLDSEADLSPGITLQTWIRTMSLLLRGSLDEKVDYCYKVYDLHGQGKIKRNQMVIFLNECFGAMDEVDAAMAAKDLADIIIKKIDVDGDGFVSLDDFRTAVRKNPELMQCLGQCLPKRSAAYAFLATFTDMNANKY